MSTADNERKPGRGIAIFRRKDVIIPEAPIQPIPLDRNAAENLQIGTSAIISQIENAILTYYGVINGTPAAQETREMGIYRGQPASQSQPMQEVSTFKVFPHDNAASILTKNTAVLVVHQRVSMNLLGDLPSDDVIASIDQYRALSAAGNIHPELLAALVGPEYATVLAAIIENNAFFAQEFWAKYTGARTAAGLKRHADREMERIRTEMEPSVMQHVVAADESTRMINQVTPRLQLDEARREILKFMQPPSTKRSDYLPHELITKEPTDPDDRLAFALFRFATTYKDPEAQRVYNEYRLLLQERNGKLPADQTDPATFEIRITRKRNYAARLLHTALMEPQMPQAPQPEKKGLFRKNKAVENVVRDINPNAPLTPSERRRVQFVVGTLTADVLSMRALLQQHTDNRDRHLASIDAKHLRYLAQIETLGIEQAQSASLLMNLRTVDEYTSIWLKFLVDQITELYRQSKARAQAGAAEAVYDTVPLRASIEKIAKKLEGNEFLAKVGKGNTDEGETESLS